MTLMDKSLEYSIALPNKITLKLNQKVPVCLAAHM